MRHEVVETTRQLMVGEEHKTVIEMETIVRFDPPVSIDDLVAYFEAKKREGAGA